ncbi:MAG: hypothetical protein AAFQ43_14195 [Bacteroidota bacterium]
MSTPENTPAPISRRESLKRAAGALALGLGAPAALAAEADVSMNHFKLEFYKADSERASAAMRVPHDVIDKLRSGEDGWDIVIVKLKFTNTETRESQLFEAWPSK